MDRITGYMHPLYANSLREFGKPRELPRCGGWILERSIPGAPYTDAMGCYPLFSCQDWSQLHEDMKDIESQLLSLALVTDPFGAFDLAYLEDCFHVVKPFKNHLIADLSKNVDTFISKHHKYYARKALMRVRIEICEEPYKYVDEWVTLYGNLIRKHNIVGIRAFSKTSFLEQMTTPGLVLVVGKLGDEVIGAHLIAIQDNVAYSHLAAFSDVGYRYNASYAIYWATLKYLAEKRIRSFDLGAAAGTDENARDGLSWFKSGWSNEGRMVYFCGRIFDNPAYTHLCHHAEVGIDDYFPAYRRGEF